MVYSLGVKPSIKRVKQMDGSSGDRETQPVILTERAKILQRKQKSLPRTERKQEIYPETDRHGLFYYDFHIDCSFNYYHLYQLLITPPFIYLNAHRQEREKRGMREKSG